MATTMMGAAAPTQDRGDAGENMSATQQGQQAQTTQQGQQARKQQPKRQERNVSANSQGGPTRRVPTPPKSASSAGSRAKPLATRRARGRLKRRMTQKLLERKEQTRQQKEETRTQVKEKLDKVRKVPLDVLAAEWLNDTAVDTRTRMYLVETCLGSVVLAMEKLLREVQRRELLDAEEMTPSFNPINYLAQALMRNNPRFSNFADASPYMRSLSRVELELRDRVYDITHDQQAKRQAELRRRKQLMEEKQQQVLARIQDLVDTAAPTYTVMQKSKAYAILREHDPEQVLFPQLFDTERPVDESGDLGRGELPALLAPLLGDLPHETAAKMLRALDAASVTASSSSSSTTTTALVPAQAPASAPSSPSPSPAPAYATLTSSYPTTIALFADSGAVPPPHEEAAEEEEARGKELRGGGQAVEKEEAEEVGTDKVEEAQGEGDVNAEEGKTGEAADGAEDGHATNEQSSKGHGDEGGSAGRQAETGEAKAPDEKGGSAETGRALSDDGQKQQQEGEAEAGAGKEKKKGQGGNEEDGGEGNVAGSAAQQYNSEKDQGAEGDDGAGAEMAAGVTVTDKAAEQTIDDGGATGTETEEAVLEQGGDTKESQA